MRFFVIVMSIVVALLLASESKAGETIKVAVIDTGYHTKSYSFPICKNRAKDFSGNGIEDRVGHGSNVSHIIHKYAKGADYCQIPINYYGKKPIDSTIEALKYAESIGAHIINYSSGGLTENPIEKRIIKRLLDKKVVIFVAAGNLSMNLDNHCLYFPACYDERLIVVGNGRNGKHNIGTNYGRIVDVWQHGNFVTAGGYTLTGTSQATAIAAGKFIKMIDQKRRPNEE